MLNLLKREAAETFERRDAAARPQTFDSARLTVEATIASNEPVRRTDERGEYDEILSIEGADLEGLRGAAVLNGHRQDGVESIVGVIEEARREANQIVARIRFSSRADVAPIVEDVRSGIITGLSIGYTVDEWRNGEANGRRQKIAVRWSPKEVSIVAVPADSRARMRHEPAPSGRASINRQIRELAARAGAPREVADSLIDRESSVEEAREAVLENMLTRSRVIRTAHNDRSMDNPEAFIHAAGEALYVRTAPNHAPSGPARQFIGMRVDDIARECLRRAGVWTTGLYGESLISRALGGLHSTSDFALVLGDTVSRSLRASYEAAPSGIRQLARETTAADFRRKSRLILDSTGLTLEKVNESGEFRSGTMAEAGESYRLETFGRIFGITRQALVNDDIGAFTDLTRRLGQAAAAFEAQFLVDLLQSNAGLGPTMSDTNPLFDAAHGNISASGAAPGETTLSAARLAMRKQTGPSGGLINVVPRFFLAPPALETASEKLLTDIQAVTTDDVNPFSRLSLVVEPRLTSATRWYVVADPAAADGLEFSYLQGQPGPQTETQSGFRIDGVEVKVRLDYGAGFVDHRGWYSNAGA